ncbi:aromatic hydrocarbon degradation protein [Shewanella sp. OPT22]|nr:aromatic hydrocarbon degradation protein [Shewanella sp. OPT22]
MKLFNKTSIAVAITLVSGHVFASGFQFNSQSATGIGRALSGDAAIGDNASVLARNPAAMALFSKSALSGGLTYVQTDVRVKDVESEISGQAIGHLSDAAANKFVPNFYYIHPVNDKFAFGVAAFTNFGTGTNTTPITTRYNDAFIRKGGQIHPLPFDLLGQTDVETITLNASASYRINENLSLGLGLDSIYGSGKLVRQGVIGNLPKDVGADITTPLTAAYVDADGWGFGGIVGLLYEFNKDNRIGISYRKSPDIKVDGQLEKLDSTSLQQKVFNKLEIPLPDIFQIGGFHQLTNRFAIHYTAQLTTWKNFDQITLEDGELAGAKVPNEPLKEYHWKDSWLYSVGATYMLNDQWTVRGGLLYDNKGVDKLTSISIPDSNRIWYTGGVSYKLDNHNTVDLGVALVRGQNTRVDEASSLTGNTVAHTHGNAIYYGLQYNYQF